MRPLELGQDAVAVRPTLLETPLDRRLFLIGREARGTEAALRLPDVGPQRVQPGLLAGDAGLEFLESRRGRRILLAEPGGRALGVALRIFSFKPGVELVLEAHEGYWRKMPAVKRLVFHMVPDESTRLAMLKRGEVDIAHALRGALAQEVRRTAGLKLAATVTAGSFFVSFTSEQWDPKSPWHDQRVRLAASVAIDRQAISQAETLGFAKPAASIVPSVFEVAWPAPPIAYDPERARKLLAEAGYPGGFDAGDYTCDASFSDLAEAVVNYLKTVGIRTRMRPLERAAFFAQVRDRKPRNLLQAANGAYGNAATRIEREMTSGGLRLLSRDRRPLPPAGTRERKTREALLHQIQKIAYDRVMFAPIWEFAQLHGVGARVEEPGLRLRK